MNGDGKFRARSFRGWLWLECESEGNHDVQQSSISTSFVFVTGGWVVTTGGEVFVVCVPIDSDVADVAVDKADDIFGVVDSELSSGRHLQRLVPGPTEEGRHFCEKESFDRVFYAGLFEAEDAGPPGFVEVRRRRGVGISVASAESVAGIICIGLVVQAL